jgi:uncharacterized heparinase superfamily protein
MTLRPARGAGRRATDLLARSGATIDALPAHLRYLWHRRLLAPLHGSGLYRWWLGRSGADKEPRALPVAILAGNIEIARGIVTGEFRHDGEPIVKPAPFANPAGASTAWCDWLSGFDWLADLASFGDAGRQPARQLLDRWIAENPPARGAAWRPDIAGRRLANWLLWQNLFLAPVPADFRARYLRSVHLHVNHLANAAASAPAGSATVAALKGLILGALALDDSVLLARGWRRLDAALAQQVLSDGMHIERSPRSQLQVLRDLAEISMAYGAVGREIPPALLARMESMAPALRMFRHGDGALALFNDSVESDADTIERVLASTGAGRSRLDQAPNGGFQRLAQGGLTVIVDTGRPAPPGFDVHAHAGTLALEISSGRERLIVNCGAHPWSEDWREVQRHTAAHSTLVIDDMSSSELKGEGLGRRVTQVTCRREEVDGQIWLDASHDGYAANLGVIHQRRLYLSDDGEDLRGEDRIAGRGGVRFTLRFHMHPDVDASLAQGGTAALLRLKSGQGWRLRIDNASLSLEESVYLGKAGQAQRTQQLAANGTLEGDETIVRWALTREDRKKRARRPG